MTSQPQGGRPTVSVVVATLNGERTLRRCLESIFAQQGVTSQVVVMDGGSTDGTIEVIKSFQADIDFWNSEPDDGIYHAWNKALRHASGEWICFLGADDLFASPSALVTLVRAAQDADADFVSGKAALIDENGRVLRKIGEPWDWDRLKIAQFVVHPGSLHRRRLFEGYGDFDESLNIAGDYEFLLRVGRLKATYVAEVLVHLGTSGLSKTQILEVLRETRRIQAQHPDIGAIRAYTRYFIAMSKGLARRALCRS